MQPAPHLPELAPLARGAEARLDLTTSGNRGVNKRLYTDGKKRTYRKSPGINPTVKYSKSTRELIGSTGGWGVYKESYGK